MSSLQSGAPSPNQFIPGQNIPEDKEKRKLLDVAVGAIEKQFGKGSIMRLGKDSAQPVEVISTGCLSIDIALGVGGLAKGRIIEIFGPESSGKTTMTLHAIAEGQRQGGMCAFIDAEHALDTTYAKKIGVDLDNLLVSQPDSGEQALEIVEMLVRSNAVDMIVVDSVAALTPKAELEGEMGDKHMGLQARLMSQALRKLTGVISRSKCVLIFINQLRMKIGVMFGNPETTTGGNALKFYSSVRLDIRRISSVKDGEDTMGNRVRVKVVKNKLAAPFKQAEFDLMFDQGFSRSGDLLDLAVNKNIVKKAGTWFSYGEDRLGQGRDAAKSYLEEHLDVMASIEKEVKREYGIGRPSEVSSELKPELMVEADAAVKVDKSKVLEKVRMNASKSVQDGNGH
ncbi:MAG: recombinase RecA [Oligoflexales bacterium]|nr:recombinase RecA [Oligoflexales bacterium]